MRRRSIVIQPIAGLIALALLSACPPGANTPIPAYPPANSTTANETAPVTPTRVNTDFLRLYAKNFGFRLGAPTSVVPVPEGDEVLFLRSEPNKMTRNLYSFDVATGTEKVLLRAKDLVESEGELPAAEAARRQRQRLTAAGIARYRLSRDGRFILAPLAGKLFIFERATGKIRSLESKSGWAIDPRWSPDGSHLSYIIDDDLYAINVATGAETRLTERTAKHVHNGVAEFVAQEEMSRSQGYWWSPDGKYLAYQKTDTSMVETLHIADASRPETKPQSWPYPRVGTANADVRLGVLPVTGGETVWVEWDRKAYPYMAKVVWSDNAPLTVLVQNRTQTEEVLLAVDRETGETTQLLVERDSAWVNIDAQMPRWLDDGKHFLWTSERNGWWQLELRRADGSLARALTVTSFPYRSLAHIDEERDVLYANGNAPGDATQSHLYRLTLSGSEQTPTQITEGVGLHFATFARNGAIYISGHMSLQGPMQMRVMKADGTEVGVIESHAPKPPFEANIELTKVTIQGREHSAMVLRPRDFDTKRKYPVLVHVYGGPHSQMVTAIGRRYIIDQWMADHGFIVVATDSRGTPNRGREWERAIKGDLSTVSLDDQAAGLVALGARYPEMDLQRVGIWGWSFGGYMTSMALTRRPDVFHAGVAGAPVTDWRDYDTHYTERYMGLAKDNQAGYTKADVLTYAGDLERPLMIVHGTGDDNVYFVHALKLIDRLTRAGKDYIFVPLLGKTHMVAEPEMRLRLNEKMMKFFIEHLYGKRPAHAGP